MTQQEREKAKNNAIGCMYLAIALIVALTAVSYIADEISK